MANYRIVRFPNRGRGIEATEDIPRGTIVITSPCVALPKGELHDTLARYAFRWGDKAALAFGDASFLNHSESANCDSQADQANRTIVVRTTVCPARRGATLITAGMAGFVRSLGDRRHSTRSRAAESYREADRLKEAARTMPRARHKSGF
jgi:hypothetical protein